jgi:hypothetical protein
MERAALCVSADPERTCAADDRSMQLRPSHSDRTRLAFASDVNGPPAWEEPVC